jgi:serine/threonine protein kinase
VAHEPGSPQTLGRYRLLRRLARGGMAEIFLAHATGIEGFEKLVVIKRILPQFAGNPEFVRMFLDEARLAATLHHPNIAQVYDVGMVDGQFFFAMEHIHGQDLRAILRTLAKAKEPMPLGEALTITIGVCSGLHYAHEKRGLDGQPLGIIHRDVSPSNVLVTYDGCPKLVDFGIAKAATSSVETQAGAVRGKTAYLSPEQCRCEALDRRSDVFEMGIVLYETSTRSRLFGGDSDFATMRAIVDHAVPPPSIRRSDFPPELERIVMKALAANPEDRYQTVQDLQLDLESFAREQRLVISAIALNKFMERLFRDQILAWREAQSAGKNLGEHLLTQASAPSMNRSLVIEVELPTAATSPASAAEEPDLPATSAASPSALRQAGVERSAAALPSSSPGEVVKVPATWRRRGAVLAAVVLAVGGAVVAVGLRGRSAGPATAAVALQVVTTPPGATVHLGGTKQVFVTPSTFQVTRTPRLALRLELDGHHPHEESVALGPAETARVIRVSLQSLQPALGALEVRSSATKATWRLNGRPVGDGSGVLRLDGLAPGPHQVTVEATGHEPRTEVVEVAAGQRLERGWTLKPTAGGAKPSPKRGAERGPERASDKPSPVKKDPGRVRVFDKL